MKVTSCKSVSYKQQGQSGSHCLISVLKASNKLLPSMASEIKEKILGVN